MGTLDATFAVAPLKAAVDALTMLTGHSLGTYLRAATRPTEPDVVWLAASGNGVECHLPVPAELHQPGTALLEVPRFGRLLRALPRKGTLRVASGGMEGERVTCTTPILTATIEAPQPELLPPLMGTGTITGLQLGLPALDLRAAIATLWTAMAVDETRPALAAMYVEAQPAGIRCSAADGFRLTTTRLGDLDPDRPPCTALIPALAVLLLRRVLRTVPADALATITVQAPAYPADPADRKPIDTGLIEVTVPGGCTILAIPSGSQFPAYQRIIPNGEPEAWAVVSAADVAAATRLVGATMAKDRPTLVTATADSNVLLLHATEGDELARVALPCMAEGHGTLSFRVNPRFLGQVATSFGPEGWLRLAHGPEPFGPIRVTQYQRSEADLLHLIMPMHTGREG